MPNLNSLNIQMVGGIWLAYYHNHYYAIFSDGRIVGSQINKRKYRRVKG